MPDQLPICTPTPPHACPPSYSPCIRPSAFPSCVSTCLQCLDAWEYSGPATISLEEVKGVCVSDHRHLLHSSPHCGDTAIKPCQCTRGRTPNHPRATQHSTAQHAANSFFWTPWFAATFASGIVLFITICSPGLPHHVKPLLGSSHLKPATNTRCLLHAGHVLRAEQWRRGAALGVRLSTADKAWISGEHACTRTEGAGSSKQVCSQLGRLCKAAPLSWI